MTFREWVKEAVIVCVQIGLIVGAIGGFVVYVLAKTTFA